MQQNYQLIWQTGKQEYTKYLNLKSESCSIHNFIERMDLAYAASDMVISRAGAIAISEISFLSKLPKKIVTYLFDTFFFLSKVLKSSFFERATILLFINLH